MTERPLEEARKRIEERKAKESLPKAENKKVVRPDYTENPIFGLAEERFLENIFPEPLKNLLQDVLKTIVEKEQCDVNASISFEYSTTNTKEMAKLLTAGKNPIKSALISFSSTIVEKGRVEDRITFGHPGIIKEKAPDIVSKINFEVHYLAHTQTVTWKMGDLSGSELKEGKESIDNDKWVLRTQGDYVQGGLKYSEGNMLELAEDLVTQIDLGRYKYVVHDLPVMKLEKG